MPPKIYNFEEIPAKPQNALPGLGLSKAYRRISTERSVRHSPAATAASVTNMVTFGISDPVAKRETGFVLRKEI